MKCPHCNKKYTGKYEDTAHRNAESYGSSGFCLRCNHCNKKFTFWITVKTIASKPVKANNRIDTSFSE